MTPWPGLELLTLQSVPGSLPISRFCDKSEGCLLLVIGAFLGNYSDGCIHTPSLTCHVVGSPRFGRIDIGWSLMSGRRLHCFTWTEMVTQRMLISLRKKLMIVAERIGVLWLFLSFRPYVVKRAMGCVGSVPRRVSFQTRARRHAHARNHRSSCLTDGNTQSSHCVRLSLCQTTS